MASSLKRLQAEHGDALSAHHRGEDRKQSFLMATGFECSYPTVQGGRRRDELESTRHYERWREDFAICRLIGAHYVRYGVPYYRMHQGPGRYDWSFADEVLPAMWDAGLIPILDLCHFGVPDWVGGFQNPDWPAQFAEFAGAFAERYPWIKLYTPVNEMMVCARFSAQKGWWNEQEKSDRAFVRAHNIMCRATLLAIGEILKRRADAVFIQSEAAQVFLEQWPETGDVVRFKNHHRFITFDILYGRPPDGDVMNFLYENGTTKQEYEWFMHHGAQVAPYCVMGMDYYATNETVVNRDGEEEKQGAMLGWDAIAIDYYRRYRRPMMLTETNAVQKEEKGEEAIEWLRRTWYQARYLQEQGVAVLGYTWYSLTDQIDWDIQLREIRGKVVPNGLFTLDREPRPVAPVYQHFAKTYGGSELIRAVPKGFVGEL